MIDFRKNKWKFAPFAVLGVLALVLTTPQANATADISQLTQQILGIVKSPIYGNQAIMNAINSLSGSAATSEDVSNLEDKVDALAKDNGAFKIVRGGTINSSIESIDQMECISDYDYILHVFTDNPDFDSDKLNISSDGTLIRTVLTTGTFEFTQGGHAGETIKIVAVQAGDIGFAAHVTLETAKGATASCIRS